MNGVSSHRGNTLTRGGVLEWSIIARMNSRVLSFEPSVNCVTYFVAYFVCFACVSNWVAVTAGYDSLVRETRLLHVYSELLHVSQDSHDLRLHCWPFPRKDLPVAYLRICMYACMYVCTNVNLYVCMYIRMHVYTYVCMYVCMDGLDDIFFSCVDTTTN